MKKRSIVINASVAIGMAGMLFGCIAPQREQPMSEDMSATPPPAAHAAAAKPLNRKAIATRELTIGKKWVRALLPADGEVVTEVLKEDVWTKNKQPFFRHETFEFALGKGIRAKTDDRKNERSLTPSVTFNSGFLSLKGGWRLHKRVPIHDDLFDGTVDGSAVIAYAGGESSVDSSFMVDWNESMAARALLGVGDIVEAILVGTAERKLEGEVNEKLPTLLNQKIDELLVQNHVPLGLKSHVYADVVPRGLRVRVYDYPLQTFTAYTPKFDFRLALTGGRDSEFSGNGPVVGLVATIRQRGNKLYMKLSMTAKETKKNWTEGKGEQELEFFTIPEGHVFVDVIGGTSLVLAKGYRMNGHDVEKLGTRIGILSVVGDTDHEDDLPNRCGVKLSLAKSLRIVTMKIQ
jgi:hypothetical protein